MDDGYLLCINRKNVNKSITWCKSYIFDPFTETVSIIGVDREELGKIDLKADDFIELEIYDRAKSMETPIQTILPASIKF